MVMLSKLRHFDLTDDHGGRARRVDLAIALLDSDYPPITHLFFRNAKRERVMLPWESVKGIDWNRSQINVEDVDGGQAAPTESLTKEVLLRRDVLDSLVLDLQNRRATRANDLWLEEEDGQHEPIDRRGRTTQGPGGREQYANIEDPKTAHTNLSHPKSPTS